MREHRIDLKLIEAVKRGDTKAFDALMIRYQARIFRIVAHFVRDPSEIMDVCQETFIKAYRALGKFRGDSSFYTWLYRIAINTSKNYIVSQGRRLPDIDINIEDMDYFLLQNAPKETSTPERLMIRDEIEEALYTTINCLAPDLKKTILLRELEGLSYEEIANRMECPVGTVRSRIFRARAVIDRNVLPFLQQ